MVQNVFSVPVFFIILRETIEAGIIVSILLTFASQLTRGGVNGLRGHSANSGSDDNQVTNGPTDEKTDRDAINGIEALSRSDQRAEDRSALTNDQLLRKLRIQIWAGASAGFVISLAIGGAFIGVFYSNKVHNLWAKSEYLWEGSFSLIASLLILAMGITFLRLEQSKIKWRIKLAHAFEKSTGASEERRSKAGKYALFFLPFITVLREGLEGVIFAAGVSLSGPGTSIPLAVIVGVLSGIFISYIIYSSTSHLTLHYFLIVSTSILLLVGAGLFSSACGDFQTYVFNRGVGRDVSETGDGPGSYDVHGMVWHLTYGNPEGGKNKGGGWSIFRAVLGWTNNATLGTILCYCFYWIAVIAILTYMKWSEGRTTILGLKSKAWYERRAAREKVVEENSSSDKGSPEGELEPRHHEIV
ncbi:iron permease FTR1/Fip1/EfeU [Cantharellus anzutake]|uniref:iron permease FTR1/Fip1/EfeU n=1 Tax=Cantharellus anzutake TaxID=1750568 RepID=UPI001908745A|nr:iron permease FTR1/Fip1/EfeU [Cantharellus anzutake]KAF8325868.1 iron permease FTR1/Fip1/EfeU [Cantharellus anzutake]